MRDFKHLGRADSAQSRWVRLRVLLVGAAFFVALFLLGARAVDLQVHQRGKLKDLAEDQYVRQLQVLARRGDIVDRKGVALASSVEVDSVWVDASRLPEPRRSARALARAVGLPPKELEERLTQERRFTWVKRRASPAEVARVQALGLPGVGYVKEPRRFYPLRELGAQVVGLVGTDAHGLEGLELAFEDELSGEKVKQLGLRDARGRRLLTQGAGPVVESSGATLHLTLDSQLQHVTEQALLEAQEKARAAAAIAVVLEVPTFAVLAVASSPRFNPNLPAGAPRGAFRNRAFVDTYEPGSTLKSLVVAGALERGLVTSDTSFDCEQGAWKVGRHVIHDTHPYARLTVKQTLQLSSNICAAKVGQKLGRVGLREVFAAFGLGEKLGQELPGEARGVLAPIRSDISLVTQSFGQGLTATPLQVTAAYAALGNGGLLMRPYLVEKVVDADGVVLLEAGPQPVRQAVAPEAARAVVALLESVVEKEGTAPRAALEGYRVAGKTGTAQKADPLAKGYSDKRLASFVGLVPAEAPRLAIGVFIDEPVGDVYGGLVAAPAFKAIAERALPLLGVPPSGPVQATRPSAPPAPAPSAPPARSRVVAAIELLGQEGPEAVEGAARVPDVNGLSGRVAVAQVLGAALEPRLTGSGRVVAQHPAAGSLVEKGTRVTLELASVLPDSSP